MRIGFPQSLVSAVSSMETNLARAAGQLGGALAATVDAFENRAANSLVSLTPLPPGEPDPRYDGGFIGADGVVYPASSLGEVPPILPSDGRTPNETIVYVNGAGSNSAGSFHEAQEVADATGAQVVGLDNASNGGVWDVVQALEDLFRVDQNPASASLANLVVDRLERGEPLHLMGHSQGGLIICNGLQAAHDQLKAQGWSDDAIRQRMHALIEVETLAGGGQQFIDGPRYVHYVNREDVVPMFGGVGMLPWAHPGAEAKVIHFDHFELPNPILADHALSVYLAQRKPFDDAYGAQA
jgi:hypothetical protein